MTRSTKCDTKRCRGDGEVLLLGRWLCGKCWDEHCEKETPITIEAPPGVLLMAHTLRVEDFFYFDGKAIKPRQEVA